MDRHKTRHTGAVSYTHLDVYKRQVLETANQALSWLLSHPCQLGKLGRWIVGLTSLKFEVRHIRGTQNPVADALSRMFNVDDVEYTPDLCAAVLSNIPLSFSDLYQLQREDNDVAKIIVDVESGSCHEQVLPVERSLVYER